MSRQYEGACVPENTTERSDPIRFIADQAADVDFFKGPHQRVADAVVQAIQNSEAKTIGLIGPWGSGKSTVVRLVERALAGEKPVHFHLFSYDAWIHQSDPPRRAFLEQLISFLAVRGFGDEALWKRQRNKVRRRKEKTDTITTPVLTVAGRVLLLPVFLLPIAFLFSSRGWYEAWIDPKSHGWDHWAFPIALIMIASPIIMAFAIYCWFRPSWRVFTRTFWTRDNFARHRKPYEDESILSLVSNRHVVRQQTSAIKADEPTAIEFQRLFRRILKPVSDKKERLVIVVDNLDRLDRDEAISLWTTIRSLFLGAIGDGESLTRGDLPTIILPIDASAIRKAQNAKGDQESDGQSFMDKSFDIIFYVAPPVLTNWQAFLKEKMAVVFGKDVDELWISETIRIYRWKADQSGTVTPRDIGRAVNAIAAAWLVAKPLNIPFVSVAYYAIYKGAIDADLTSAVNSPLVDISDADSNWRNSIAALHYGIDPELAAQVFLDAIVRNAVARKEVNAFRANANVEGFGTAVDRLFDNEGFLTLTYQTNLVELLTTLESTPVWADFTWSKLRRLFTAGNMWDEIGARAADSARLMFENAGEAKVKKFVAAIVEAMARWSEGMFKDQAFISTAAKIIIEVSDALDGESIAVPLPLAADERGLLELFAALADAPEALALAMTGRATKGLAADLAKQLLEVSSVRLEEKARVVLKTAPSSWDVLCTAASNSLQNDQMSIAAKSAAALILGYLYKTEQPADDAVGSNAEDGHLQELINGGFAEGLIVAAARGIVLMLLAGEAIAAPASRSWQEIVSAHPELPPMLDRLMGQWSEEAFFGLLIDQIDHDQAILPIIAPIMSAAIRRGEVGTLPAEGIVAEPQSYIKHLSDDDGSKFLELLAAQDDFFPALKAAGTTAPALGLSANLIESDSRAVRTAARKELVEKLKAVPSEEWLVAVRDGGALMETTGQLNAVLGRSIAVGQPLFTALGTLMPELIASSPRPYAVRWIEAANFLAASYRRTLFRNLRDQLLAMSSLPPQLDELLRAGGPILLNDGAFAAKSDECARLIVLPMISSGDLNWLLQVQDVVAEWYEAATADTQAVIRDALSERAAEADASEQARAELLLNRLKK